MLKPLAVASALALAGSAEAHDYSADIICRVMETDGQRSAWSFAPNTIGAEGSPVSPFVETSYLDRVDTVFDLIVANPPYVKDGDKRALSRDVRGRQGQPQD